MMRVACNGTGWLLALSLLVSLSIQAGTSKDAPLWVIADPEAFFSERNDKGELTGYAVDVVNGILAEAGVKQPILATKWQRLEKEARSKSNVLAFSLARTPQRELLYHWITQLGASRYAVLTNSPRPIVERLSDLSQFGSIAVLRSDGRVNILQQAGIKRVQQHETWKSAISAVLNDQAKGVFFSMLGLRVLCPKMTLNCGDLKPVYHHQPIRSYLVLSKIGTPPELVATFKAAAMRYKNSPEFARVSQKWLAYYQKQRDLPVHLNAGVMNLWPKPTSSLQ